MATHITNRSPDCLHTLTTTTTADPATLVVLWAWSSSSDAWLRQSNPEPAAQVLRDLQVLLADCPTVRVALTPCAAI